MPSEGRSDIDKQDIGSGNGLDGGKSDRLDDSVDEWREEELASYLRSTKIQLVEGRVPHQISGERMKPRC